MRQIESRSAPAITTSRTSGAKCAMNCARNGADLDPGPGGKLEVLRGAAFEQQAFRDIRRILEAEGVTETIEAFLVERRRGQIRGRRQ